MKLDNITVTAEDFVAVGRFATLQILEAISHRASNELRSKKSFEISSQNLATLVMQHSE